MEGNVSVSILENVPVSILEKWPVADKECQQNELTHPTIIARPARDAGACNPLRHALSPESHGCELKGLWQRWRCKPAISQMTWMKKSRALPNCNLVWRELSISTVKAEWSAPSFLSAVREEYAQYTGDTDDHSQWKIILRFAANQPHPRSQPSAAFKKALVAVDTVTLQPAVGRLTGISVLQIAFPARTRIWAN